MKAEYRTLLAGYDEVSPAEPTTVFLLLIVQKAADLTLSVQERHRDLRSIRRPGTGRCFSLISVTMQT